MNIGHYIQELLFSRQQVALPNIGTFEFVSKPSQIDTATGTITPPSKTIRFKFGEDTGYSILATYISRKEQISATEAINHVNSYAEELLERLKNKEDVDISGVGILKMLGTGTIIFLPISTYSSLGDSLGLPILNLDLAEEATPTPHVEATPITPEANSNASAEPFELIEEESPAVEPEVEHIPVEAYATEPVAPAEPQEVPAPAPTAPPTEVDSYKPKAPAEEVSPKARFKSISSEAKKEATPLEEKSTSANEAPIPNEKGRFGWVWMFVVVLCAIAIGIIALYHYNPSYFAFLHFNQSKQTVDPKVPGDVDSSYYKAIAGSSKDTTANDSIKDSVKAATPTKADTSSKASTAKPLSAAASHANPKKGKMTNEEIENLIDKKLNLGKTVKKSNDTPQTAKKPDVKVQTSPNTDATASKSSARFDVIAASVTSAADAQKEAAALKAKGFNPQILEMQKGRIRISIGSYPSSREATNAARAAKAKLGKDVWILNPK